MSDLDKMEMCFFDGNVKQGLAYYSAALNRIKELEAPTHPDDVAKAIELLTMSGNSMYWDIADLLERQQRELAELKSGPLFTQDFVDVLEQRIEEQAREAKQWEAACKNESASCSKHQATSLKLQQRIEELDEELAQTEEAREAIDNSLRKVGKEREQLQAQVKELKALNPNGIKIVTTHPPEYYAALQENE